MTKYIISSGTSAVCELLEKDQFSTIKITNDLDKAISFNTIGEAMLEASKINDVLGSPVYRVISTAVSGNL